MSETFEAKKIAENVYWVGALDWEIGDFHGYSTNRGTTYNAYLIVDENVTLIDTVKAPFVDEMLARVASVVDPTRIDYLISNHSEMDHSGGIPKTIEAVKPEKVIASIMGQKALDEHFRIGHVVTAVKDGETLSIGKRELTFIETRMLHWPDSMFTYVPSQKLLFSQDGFGMHLASSERFTDEIDEGILEEEARKYYANILLPLSSLVLKLLDKVTTAGLEFDVIAPDHGPIYRKNLDWIVGRYAKWAAQKPTMKAVIVYDTMWESTAGMAHAVAEGLAVGGAAVKVFPLGTRHRSDAVTEIMDAGALLVGSPTLNNGMFPTISGFMTYVKGLKPQNLVGASFGSYGWAPKGAGLVQEALEEIGVEIAGETVNCKYVPTEDDLARCRALGEKVAKRLGEKCAQ